MRRFLAPVMALSIFLIVVVLAVLEATLEMLEHILDDFGRVYGFFKGRRGSHSRSGMRTSESRLKRLSQAFKR
jgi:hypothetical protein